MDGLWESRWITADPAFAIRNPDQTLPGSGINLLKRPDEFQSKQAGIAHSFLAQYFGRDRWRFVGHQTGRGRRRRGHGELNELVHTQRMSRRNTSAKRADIQRFRELNELDPGSVRGPQEHRHLQLDPRRPSLLAILQLRTFLRNLRFQWDSPVVPAH
jgi:hypothetical protein